jgi:hypothetical protein
LPPTIAIRKNQSICGGYILVEMVGILRVHHWTLMTGAGLRLH